jgi:energy-coupling factor transporter ATP-binding protein EcfA2
VRKGDVAVIVGPSGSGKSTLLRCINRLEEIQEGEIWIDGENVCSKSSNVYKVRAEVGMVFQDPDSQIIGETVREDVAFGPENLGLPLNEIAERVNWALQVMGLKDLSEKPCYLLSGGEKGASLSPEYLR